MHNSTNRTLYEKVKTHLKLLIVVLTLSQSVSAQITTLSLSSNQEICNNTIPSKLQPTYTTGTNSRPNSGTYQMSLNQTSWTNVGSESWSRTESARGYQPAALTQTTYYRLVGDVTSNIVTINVKSAFNKGQTEEDQTICYNTVPSVISCTSATGGSGSYTYQWQNSSDNNTWTDITGANSQNYTPESLITKTYFRRKDIDECATEYTDEVTINVRSEFNQGSIEGSQTIGYNTEPSELTGTSATGGSGSYTYQWQISTNNTYWSNITGANSQKYTAPELTQDTYYKRKVVDECGTLYTNSIHVSVNADLITGTIGDAQTICYNTAPSQILCSSATEGTGSYRYQWQKSSNGSTWSDISGATLQNYASPSLTQTIYYRRKVTDNIISKYSSSIKVTVKDALVAGNISNDQTICFNSRPNQLTGTNPSGGSGNYTYQWQISTNQSTWTNIGGANSNTYTPESLTTKTYFRRVVTNDCGNQESNIVTITVRSDLESGNISTGQTICYNKVPSQIICSAATGGTGSYIYQWQKSINEGTWSDIIGANSQIYTSPELTKTTAFRRKISDDCTTKYSSSVTVTVRTQLDAGEIDGFQTICYNTIPSILFSKTSPKGGSGNYTYQWQASDNNVEWTDISGETSQNNSPSILTKSTYFRRKVSDNCGIEYSNSVKVTVREKLVSGEIDGNQTIFYNTAPNQIKGSEATGGSSSYTYQWQKSSDDANWINIVGSTSVNYSPSLLTQSTYYRRKVSDNCGTDYSNSIKVIVSDNLVAGNIEDDQTICYNTAPSKIIGESSTGGSGNYIYQWQKSLNGNSWEDIVSATSKDYNPDVLILTTYLRRITTETSGVATSNTVIITVREELNVSNITNNQDICYQTTPQALSTSSITGGSGTYTYQWLLSENGVDWFEISGANNISYQPQSLISSTYFKLKVTDNCSEAYSENTLVNVFGQFTAGTIGDEQTIIYNGSPDILNSSVPVTGGSGTVAYQWQKSIDNYNWVDILGANNESYQSSALTQTTYFKRKVSCDCGSISSNIIRIIVKNENAIVGTIGDNQTICYLQNPSELKDIVIGTGIASQQWQNSINGTEWNDIIGETGISYKPNALSESTYYRKKVKTSNNGELYTNIILVTVEKELDAGEIEGTQNTCKDSTPTPLKTITEPNTINYTTVWESSYNGTTWNEINNTNTDYFEPSTLDESTYYRKKVISSCAESYTNVILITVNEKLTSGTIEEDQTIGYNETPDKIIGTLPTGGSGVYKYEWSRSIDNENWTIIAQASSDSYQPSSISKTTYFKRSVTSGTCGIQESNTVTVVVSQQLLSGAIGNNQTICYNSIPQEIKGTEAIGGIGVFSYYWETSTDGEEWDEIFGQNSSNIIPSQPVTETTYFRRKVISGTSTAYTNIVRIDHLEEVLTPQITYTDRYCKNEDISINSNLSSVLWYDENMSFISDAPTLTATATESTKYYYQVVNTIGCNGDLKEIQITVDFVETDIQTNAINNVSIQNGERITVNPNIISNFSSSEIEYTWTFDNQDEGWYETMFDQTPSQYFHWKGWYDITLVTKTPTGCKYTIKSESAFFVDEETEDSRMKSDFTGEREYNLDPNFGISKETNIKVYPSLFNAKITVELENFESKANLYIYDITGRLIAYEDVEEGTNIISTTELTKGVYIIRITSEGGVEILNKKVIKA